MGCLVLPILGVLLGIYFLYACACTWLFRRVMRSMQIPGELKAEQERDRTMIFLVFLSWRAMGVGAIILLCTYAIGIYRHFRERRPGAVPSSVLPRVPRFALSELLVMVFSIGAYPLVMDALGQGWTFVQVSLPVQRALVLLTGLLVFPLCFASAFQRLDGNRVPLGRTRLAFLFLYPYCMYGCSAAIGGVALFFPVLWLGPVQAELPRYAVGLVVRAMVGALLLAVGAGLASRAKREGEAVPVEGIHPPD